MKGRNPDNLRSMLQAWKWPLVAAAYTVIGLFFAGQNALSYLIDGDSVPWDSVLVSEMIYWYVWLALTPLIFRFNRGIPMDRERWKRGVLWHLMLCVVVSPLQNGLWMYMDLVWIDGVTTSRIVASLDLLADNFWVGALTSFYKYWVLVGAWYGIRYYLGYLEQERRSRELELQAARLNTRLIESRLDVLKMQLHPHFLFNALNTVTVLMKEDMEKARTMLVRLGELLRVTLESREANEVSLDRELEILNYYLEVEKARFEERLEVHMEVGKHARQALVPYLLLQPIVENAVRHGLSTRTGGGRVSLAANRDGDWLVISVEDSGRGRHPEQEAEEAEGSGIGLSNTRERLWQLYGERQRLELEHTDSGGTRVTIRLPYRTVSGEEAGDEEELES